MYFIYKYAIKVHRNMNKNQHIVGFHVWPYMAITRQIIQLYTRMMILIPHTLDNHKDKRRWLSFSGCLGYNIYSHRG